MITFKELTKEDIRKDYLERKGFVFKSVAPSSDESVTKLCDVLITNRVTNVYPEFVAKLEGHIHVFVYGNDFDMPFFLRKSDAIGRFFGKQITVDSIRRFPFD